VKHARRSSQTPAGTEQLHPLAEDLDVVSARDVVERLHREDLVAVRAVGAVLDDVARAAELAASALKRGGRLIYVGAGTSGRLGLLDAVECPPTFGTDPNQVQAVLAGGPSAVISAIEGAEDDDRAGAQEMVRKKVGAKDCVVGITASATTPFVRGALAQARKRKAKTVLLCSNNVKLPKIADVIVRPPTGAELLAGSTRLKAGTATKLVLNAISTAAMAQLGKVYRGRMIDVRATNVKLKARAIGMVSELGGVTPAIAAKLLRESLDSPRLAVIRAWTGADLKTAQRLAKSRTLRQIEPDAP
jgi:N-acetylmuramic acid 6-phosphate etherase